MITHPSPVNNGNTDDNTSESDSLINPRLSKRKTKPVNYEDMCENSKSESDDTSFIDVKPKLAKPKPGMAPSNSRVTAQNLIARRRASKGLNTQYPEYSTDSDPNITEHDDYDGVTEDYDIPDIKPDSCKNTVAMSPVKSEPTPIDNSSKVPTPFKKLKTRSHNKSRIRREHPKPKPKMTLDTQVDPSKLKLSKKGKTGEWHIAGYARLKQKKQRKHTCPATCKFSCDSTKMLNEHYRKSHPLII